MSKKTESFEMLFLRMDLLKLKNDARKGSFYRSPSAGNIYMFIHVKRA